MSTPNDSPGAQARRALVDMISLTGTDCHAGGEKRKALIQEDKEEGYHIFKFLEEFPLQTGDRIKNWATEQNYEVVSFRSVSKFGVFWVFEVCAGAVGPS